MTMNITITEYKTLELNPKQVEEIGLKWLDGLTNGRWINNNKLMEEQATSHRYDVIVGDNSHPDFNLVQAVMNLRKILNK